MKRHLLLPAFALLFACSPDLAELPGTASLRCESNAECPGERVCVADLQRCLDRLNPCIEPAGEGFRTVEAGRRCTAAEGADGVCVQGDCASSHCGDGIVDRARTPPEACDDGERNSDLLADACRLDCQPARCGDGVRDSGEACDDGNPIEEDGCLSSCVLNRCGDGIVDPQTEECDDGNELSGDDCTVLCERARCGDGFLHADREVEHCEDGNENPNDGCDRCRETSWSARLLAGAGEGGGQAAAVSLDLPLGLAADPHGNLFVADSDHHRVVKIELATGQLVRVAGVGSGLFGGDGGPASQAALHSPTDVAVDKLGNLFVADVGSSCIRRIDALTGIIEVAVGIPNFIGPPSGDSTMARHAHIPSADSVAIDSRGNLFLNQRLFNTIRWVDASTGYIHTYAGTGAVGNGGDGGPAVHATLTDPTGLAVDSAGNLFVASGRAVRRIDAETRTISTVATLPSEVSAIDVRADGRLAVALTYDNRILEIAPGGSPVPVAGTGAEGFAGDGGPAAQALLTGPMGLAWGADGVLFVSDSYNHRVRRVGAGSPRNIDTVAGTGSPLTNGCFDNDCVSLDDVRGVAVDPSGRILLAEGARSVVRWVHPALGTNGLVAGQVGVPGMLGVSTDGRPAAQALLSGPKAVAADSQGNLFIAEGGAHRIRRVDATTGLISTYAGSERGDSTGPVPALELQMEDPLALVFDEHDHLFVADRGNGRVRRIDAGTREATVVASGISDPGGLALDAQGRLLVADSIANRVWRVAADGSLEPFAGTGTRGFEGDGAAPELARLDSPSALARAADGAILIADTGNSRVRRVTPDGARIETISGTGELSGPSGDGGPASAARLTEPSGLAVDAEGGVIIGDAAPGREPDLLRRIDPGTGIITTILGPVRPAGSGPLATSQLGSPAALASLEIEPGRNLLLVADGITALRSVELAGEGRVATQVGYLRGIERSPAPAAFFRQLATPLGIAADARDGSIYATEAEGHTLLKISTRTEPWTLEELYGSFLDPGSGPGKLDGPRGLLLDTARDTLFVADGLSHTVRALDLRTTPPTSTVVAGTPGEYGFLDAADATEALLYRPEALALGADGSLYVADGGNHRVRRIERPLGPGPASIETVTGLGLPAWGEGQPASLFPIDSPGGLAVDSHGNLFIAGGGTVWIVAAGEDGLATGADPMRIVYGRLPRLTLPESETLCLTGLLVAETPEAPESRVYLLDGCQGYLLALERERL